MSGSLTPAWDNNEMALVPRWLRSERAKAVLIVILVVTLAVYTWIVPPHAVVLHNILHHLNILPFMLAGMFFGWRGALKTVLFTAVLMAPSIYRHWFRAPLDSQDQVVELGTFGAAGIIAGFLSERERMQRLRVETTKLELERVYTELRQSLDQIKRTERLTAAGQLSASLAHEIRNPLASISGATGILARGQASQEARSECLEILTKESQRLNKLLTNFLNFARPRLPRLQNADPREMIHAVGTLAQHAARRKGVVVEMQLADGSREVPCDQEQIKQLLLNLILNALDATESHGKVIVRSFFLSEHLCIEVCDEGRGIPASERERIFEPFFTTKETGTGLGLAIASNIASQHGGALTCRPNGAKGTIFRTELPLAVESSIVSGRVETR
ncbi:MAG: ATP-binding protein [Edaphobacter sp.]|uniref:sensor histidine kinase n=1 Tax=Edaphobacter sp. TaxID=1934404 RepID=UPI0023A377C9|nr:ATP-binding protein [Edaphobacter sp.]MDE1177134.1 ATP-binding protein [Edaphobacter sp.]